MAWTFDQKMQYLLHLPWTIVPEVSEDGDRLLRVKELPSAVGCGEEDPVLIKDFWDALEATLEAYLEGGTRPPLPSGISQLPWELRAASTAERKRNIVVSGQFQTQERTFSSSAVPLPSNSRKFEHDKVA